MIGSAEINLRAESPCRTSGLFGREKRQCRNHVAWICAAVVRRTVSAHSLFSRTNRNRTSNNNITTVAQSPHNPPTKNPDVAWLQVTFANVTILADSYPVTYLRSQIRLRFNCGSTAVRLPFDCNSTALRPFVDLRYVRRLTYVWTAALRSQ